MSDRFLMDASYLNLQNINFGYTLPSNFTKKVGIEKVRVYLACENVWYWSKRQGFDPRYSYSGATSQATYSPVRTISGGININSNRPQTLYDKRHAYEKSDKHNARDAGGSFAGKQLHQRSRPL